LPTVLFEKEITNGNDPFTPEEEKTLTELGEREAVSFHVEINDGVKVKETDFGMPVGIGAPSRTKSFTLIVK
jgi:hypothetical protein